MVVTEQAALGNGVDRAIKLAGAAGEVSVVKAQQAIDLNASSHLDDQLLVNKLLIWQMSSLFV